MNHFLQHVSALLRLLCVSSLLVACTNIPSFNTRVESANALAGTHGWVPTVLETKTFTLASFSSSVKQPTEVITIYLEGDGMAWIGPDTPSFDPTPLNAVGLKLALAQPEGTAIYLARPCQFINTEINRCDNRYWLNQRFSLPVINAMNNAIDQIKKMHGATHIQLVGYSGGGALAMLLAVKRNDVKKIATVAGNVDPDAWTKLHGYSALEESLNPIEYIKELAGLKIILFAGEKDRNIPPEISRHFISYFPGEKAPILHVIPDLDHSCCWDKLWPSLWKQFAAY